MERFISYLRVSTDRQGRSGLGLEAQRQAIDSFVAGRELLAEFMEVESGKRNDRPQLRAAMEECRSTGAILVIAKLDRLARNLAFIASLMESGVEFIACDFPQANRLAIHILAAVAEHERDMISRRTKEALAAARARGVQLGNPVNLQRESGVKGRAQSLVVRQEKAAAFAQARYPEIRRLKESGLSQGAIARHLNSRGILTAQGKRGAWTATAVRILCLRVEKAP